MNNKTVSLTFAIGDLPMIAHAFSIARATAMVCGHKLAKERLNQYHKIIDALIPEHCKMFDEEEWAEICIRIAECKEWSVTVSKSGWVNNHYDRGGRVKIRVDGHEWINEYLYSKKNEFKEDDPEITAIKEFLTELAGLDSKQVDV